MRPGEPAAARASPIAGGDIERGGTVSERDAWQDRRPVDHGRSGIDLTEAEILRRYADRLAAVA